MSDVTIKMIEEIEPFTGPHAIEGIRFRAVRETMGITSWGMNVLELDPNCTNHPEHHHRTDNHEEVYLVLKGAVVLVAGGHEHELDAGHMARVSADTTRKLVTRSQGAMVLAMGGTPGQAYKPSMGG